MALPCASAKRPRLHPDFLMTAHGCGRRLSPRDRAIIKEMNESVFAMNFLTTGGYSESCEKVEYCMLSTDVASPTLRRLHSVISDFRPSSGTESSEAALRILLASRAIGVIR